MLTLEKSKELLQRGYNVIPGASQTFSKGPSQWPRGMSPNYLVRGKGAWVWDIDGNKYLDHLMALGPIILGYGCEEVNNVIKKQIDDGVVFSQMHPLEVEVAEKLVDIIPSAEMVKFFKNGTDATSAAIRVARAYTGREYVAYCGYHGWHDWSIIHTSRAEGIPIFNKELAHAFVYNDISSLSYLFETHKDKFAAVIMEPIGVEIPLDGYLRSVKELCKKHGVILIFDEVVTGFRTHIGGYQALSGVIPDLSCFGKAMANGMPLAALVGHKDIMALFNSKLFVSGTFGGEAASLAACSKTIDILIRDNVLAKIENYSQRLCRGILELVSKHKMKSHLKLMGLPQRSVLIFKNEASASLLAQKTYFMQECIRNGLLYFCSHVPCFAHGQEELSFSLGMLDIAMEKFAKALSDGNLLEQLESDIIEPVFRSV
jgi:glutamate-1-semialdehyde aminotransferase